MIKEAIEKIADLANPIVCRIGELDYIINKGGGYEQIKPELNCVEIIHLHSLSGLVSVIRNEIVEYADDSTIYLGAQSPLPIYLEAYGFNEVKCFTAPVPALGFERITLYHVKATDVDEWKADTTMTYEEALIAVRTRFQHTPDSEYLLRLLSNISNGAKITCNDNGVASTILMQKGVALQEGELIRPIVKLRPYRTFQELEQPESEFHIRVSERGIRFVEADGSMWKLAARKSIAAFMSEELADMIEDKKVIVFI